MKHHRKSSKSGELAGDSQWHAMASAKILFGEFRSHAQIYGAFTLTLGLLFGLHHGPRTDVEPPEPNTERKTELADVRKQIPAAPRQDKDQQKELQQQHSPWQDRDSQGSLESEIFEHVMLPKLSGMPFSAFQPSVSGFYIQVCACLLCRRIYSEVNMLKSVDEELV